MPEDQRRALADLFRDVNKIGQRPTAIARRVTTGTNVISDRGCRIAVSAGITIPANVYAAGDWFQLYNDSASSITVTEGASLTMRLDGTASTAALRTLLPRQSAMVWFNSPTEAVYAPLGTVMTGPCGGVMSNYGGGDPFSQCQLLPKNGPTVLIDGAPETIPAGVISVSGGVQATYSSTSVDRAPATSLSSGNLYFIYACMVAGVMTLDFSLTGYTTHSVYGYPVKSSDSSCTLVGLCFIQNTYTYTVTGGSGYVNGRYRNVVLTGGAGSGATADITVAGGIVTIVSINKLASVGTKYANADSLTTANANLGGSGSGFSITIANSALTTFGGARGQTITSYYHRFHQRLQTAISASTTATANTFSGSRLDDGLTNLSNGERQNNFLEWVQWFDEAPTVRAYANMGNNTAGIAINLATSITDALGTTDAVNGFQATMLATSTIATSVQLSTENDAHDATGYYRTWTLGWGASTTTTLAGILYADGVNS